MKNKQLASKQQDKNKELLMDDRLRTHSYIEGPFPPALRFPPRGVSLIANKSLERHVCMS